MSATHLCVSWQRISPSPRCENGRTHESIAFSISDDAVPTSDTTTPASLPPSAWPDSCVHLLRSPPGATTCASITFAGMIVLGLGGRGKLSDVPDGGGVKTESGRRGSELGPLRRAPTPGEGGTMFPALISAAATSSRGRLAASRRSARAM